MTLERALLRDLIQALEMASQVAGSARKRGTTYSKLDTPKIATLSCSRNASSRTVFLPCVVVGVEPSRRN